jgi:hypothetical protein
MTSRTRILILAGSVVLLLAVASESAAEIDDQLSAYTGDNATGYLEPLANAFGADLNSGLFHSADIPRMGFYIGLETRMMAVMFSEGDRTFLATTEEGFEPQQTVEAPTVVGSGETVIVEGSGGTSYAFPGGLDLHSFTLAVPQLRIGSLLGTEGLVRYIAVDTGSSDIGKIGLYGFGLRHSISQYFGPTLPVDVAGGFFWQRFSVGENEAGNNVVDARALSIGVQVSKRFGPLEPYAGLSRDTFTMDVAYESDDLDEMIDLEFDSGTIMRATVGVSLRLGFLSANSEYNIAEQNSLAFGLTFGH